MPDGSSAIREGIEEHVRRVMLWELRIAPTVTRWQRFVERVLPVERWEWQTPDGRWVGYWRRHGNLPA